MYCPKCGKPLDENAAFCSGCGNQTTVSPQNPIPPVSSIPKPKKKKKRHGCLVAIIAALLFYGFLAIIQAIQNPDEHQSDAEDINSHSEIISTPTTVDDVTTTVDEPPTTKEQTQEILTEAIQAFDNEDYREAFELAIWAKILYSIDKPLSNDSLQQDILAAIEKFKPKVLELYNDKITKNHDDIDEVTFIQSNNEQTKMNPFACYAYVVEKSGYNPSIRLFVGFHADNWVFIESITFKCGNNSFDISISPLERKTEVANGIYEWIDIKLSDLQQTELGYVLQEDDTNIRFRGNQYYKDFKLSNTQKANINLMLEYYKILAR